MELDDRKEWDRQDGEAAEKFSLFVTYRDMHPSLRSVRAVVPLDPARRTLQTIKTYSQQWKWSARAGAYDAHADALRQARSEDVRSAHDQAHIAQSEAMMQLCNEAVAMIDPAKVGPQYLPRLVDTAVKISHLATGSKAAGKETQGKTFEQEVAELAKEMNK